VFKLAAFCLDARLKTNAPLAVSVTRWSSSSHATRMR